MKKLILYMIGLAAILCITSAIAFWYMVMKPNTDSASAHDIKIPSGTTFTDLREILVSTGTLKNEKSFLAVSKLKSFGKSIKPGYYRIEPGTSNNQLINIIRSGRQTPVNVTFNNIRTLNELAGKIGGQIEADSASIMAFLSDEENYQTDGFKYETVISLFIPDTYQFYWTTDAEALYKRMLREYENYWNDERRAAAAELNLSPVDVATLASIIDDEVAKNEEKPRIAGVYLNRLKKGIPLQACPTIKFALNDFTIRRVLYEHLTVDSPYNTYMYRGLPPGPVRCPSKTGIEAVLKAEEHDYLYFAARSDFSGYHHFSRTLAEHNRYADEYQRELNRRKIYE